jgi:hypothetical protein
MVASRSTLLAVSAMALTSVLMTSVLRAQGTLAPLSSVPRTKDGKPDLSGVWQAVNTAAWDIQDHGARAGIPAGAGVVEGNEIPYLPAMLAKKKEHFEKRDTLDPETKCYLPGVPRATYMPYPFQIVQGQRFIAIGYEYAHAARRVAMDGSKHPEALSFWMGDSRGRWDGDTLVVDVSNFEGRTWFDRAGNFHSDKLHVIERYTPVTPNHLHYEVTIEDSEVFSRPWKMSMPLYRRLETHMRIADYGCVAFLEDEEFGTAVK